MELTRAQARAFLVGHLGLRAITGVSGDGVRQVLRDLRCIQLDPLDRIGTNADLVAMARVDGLRRGDVYRHLLPGHAFEHFAKERCLLPAELFPSYRRQAAETPWWRLQDRVQRLPEGVLQRVLAEVRAQGPVTAGQLTDHGPVEALDWSGWKGTAKATSMALEVLWTRCEVVVCGRLAGTKAGTKVYDVPERALPQVAHLEPSEPFETTALLDRVQAAGLLSMAAGPHWSMLSAVRTSDLPQQLVQAGRLRRVTVEGSPRPYLAPPDLLERTFPSDDGRMRILGPLDPLLWDRKLVLHAFCFEYAWEVYKPASARRWGWYVCPLLHRGALVGRLEAHAEDGRLVVDRSWRESATFDDDAYAACLARHEAAL